MTALGEKIIMLDEALSKAQLPHAFGGALALAWCTGRARGTIDVDVNLFVDVAAAHAVFAALPIAVARGDKDLDAVAAEGQVRLFWGATPVDLFLNTTDYHQEAAARTRWETFLGRRVPFLACQDLAVFKAFFNRTKDWADIEAMYAAGTLQLGPVASVLARYLGRDDERIGHLMRVPERCADDWSR